MRLLLSLALCLAPGLLPAQEPGAIQDVTPGEWREMVLGRSVTYHIGGQFWAREAYDPASDAVMIRMADGSCLEGSWSYRDGEYCFAWRGAGTSCFRHVRRQDDILVIPMVDGAPSGDIQTVAGVTDVPVDCASGLTS